MKLNKKIIGALCLLPFFASCGDFLDVQNDSEISTNIWTSEQSAQLYVNNIYEKPLIPEDCRVGNAY